MAFEMTQRSHFRRILPISQAAISLFFGGWGLWVRNSILSRPFFGSTFWDSSARFHVWPWPFKFATLLNTPAFLMGLLLSLPLDAIRPGLPEWVSLLPTLPFVVLLWYWIGLWLDRRRRTNGGRDATKGEWIVLLLFTIICAAVSSIPDS